MNSFDPQNPVDPELFYGREETQNRFKECVKEGKQGSPKNIGFVGEWGIGKTSLLNKLYSSDFVQDIPKVHITFTEHESQSFENIAESILSKVNEELSWLDLPIEFEEVGVGGFKFKKKKGTPKSVFLNTMQDLWGKCGKDLVIIFMDDFHLIYENIMDIRNCFQELKRKGCQFMLVITLKPEILSYGDIDEPFKRFFNFYDLKEFTRDDVKKMVKNILGKSGLKLDIDNEVLDKIYEETEGHPYYVTLFMYELIRTKDSDKITPKNFKKIEPEIMKNVILRIGDKFQSLTKKELEAVKRILELNEKRFEPKDIKFDSESKYYILNQLVQKEVLEKVGRGCYQFNHPMEKKYFSYKYGSK